MAPGESHPGSSVSHRRLGSSTTVSPERKESELDSLESRPWARVRDDRNGLQAAVPTPL